MEEGRRLYQISATYFQQQGRCRREVNMTATVPKDYIAEYPMNISMTLAMIVYSCRNIITFVRDRPSRAALCNPQTCNSVFR